MILTDYLRLIRASHWIKNLFVFVPLVFSLKLFNPPYFYKSLLGFIAFGLAASIVYIINDIKDIEHDRHHPKKKHRPLAAGKIPVKNAIAVIIILSAATAGIMTFLNLKFILVVAAYLGLNTFYTFVTKNLVILDIFSIAAGFMLRVAGGTFVINVEASSWLILTTMFISLFLAVMKRASEMDMRITSENVNTRKVLDHYSVRFIDQITTISAGGVILSYTLYTISKRTVDIFKTEALIYTTPFVLFGILRYMYLVYHKHQGENTIEVLLTDPQTIVNSILYITITLLVVYGVIH